MHLPQGAPRRTHRLDRHYHRGRAISGLSRRATFSAGPPELSPFPHPFADRSIALHAAGIVASPAPPSSGSDRSGVFAPNIWLVCTLGLCCGFRPAQALPAFDSRDQPCRQGCGRYSEPSGLMGNRTTCSGTSSSSPWRLFVDPAVRWPCAGRYGADWPAVSPAVRLRSCQRMP